MNPVEKLQEAVAEAIEEFSEFTLSKPVKNIDGSLYIDIYGKLRIFP